MSVFLQPIYTQTVGTGAPSYITFNNIPQGYQDLVIEISARSTATSWDNLRLAFNGSFSGYSQTSLYGDGSSVISERLLGGLILDYAGGTLPNSNSTANVFGNTKITIPNYSGGTYKQVVSENASENNAANLYVRQSYGAGLWRSTDPITSLTVYVFAGFAQYSTVTLYGVVNQADTVAPTAPTIGTVVDQAGFLSVPFTPTSNDGADSYKVVTNPASNTVYGSSSPITVPVTVGTSYTAKVSAVNSLGSTDSATSGSITTYNSFSSIATYVGTGNNIFTNIPQNYQHLRLHFVIRSSGSGGEFAYYRFNGDGGNNYTNHQINGDGASATSGNSALNNGYGYLGLIAKSTSLANAFTKGIVEILDYASTTKYKTVRVLVGDDFNGSGHVALYSGIWPSFAPITAFEFGSGSGAATVTGTQYSLYGIA